MTNEEKAKAYDEALDRCKEWASGTCEQSVNNSPKDIAEFIFPELAESEDERIREFLIGILSQGTWRKEWPFSPNEVVAYLEKQKEQSITANDLDEEIHRFFDDCIEVHDAKIYGVDERVITVDCYEITARHFAKWGEKQKEQKSANLNLTTWHRDVVYCAMCDKNLDEGLRCNLEVVYKTIKELVDRTPVVEEQKPAEWSEEDEQRIAEIEFAVMQMNTKRDDTKNKCLDWLKSLRPQPKQEWNEKDKKMLWIIQLALTKHPITDRQEKDAFDWLNSLHLQPHKETDIKP